MDFVHANPFTVIGECASPVVLDSPHSGYCYPRDFNFALPLARLRTAEDTHVDSLYSFAPELRMALLSAHFPRSYIDANRALDEIDPDLFEGQWTKAFSISPKARLGKGLIWRMLDDGTPIYDHKLTQTQYLARVNQFWRPYHGKLKELLIRAHQQHGLVVHINCHSMPSVAAEFGTDMPGIEHPDIVLGDRDGSTASPSITTFLEQRFIELGYSVWVNKPYKGVELIRAYSNPSRQKHSIQLELNRKLYMNELTLDRHSGYEKLQHNLQVVLSSLNEFVLENKTLTEA
jgi:N-formylglutamate deformylase